MTDVLAHVFYSDDDECWVATHPEYSGLSGLGDSIEQALNELDCAMELAMEVEREDSEPK